MANKIIKIIVNGKARGRGRKLTWDDVIKNNMNFLNLT